MASYLNCVTTIGICVFQRVNPDWRAFLIGIYVNSFIIGRTLPGGNGFEA